MKTIPATVYPRSQDTYCQRMPKIIFQTFKSRSVTDSFYNNFLSYIDNNPDYQYEFYDDKRMIDYVYNYDCSDFNFSSNELIHAFDSIKIPAGKSDIWRYLVIYENGGVYVDFDTYCFRSLSHIIKSDDDIVVVRLGKSSNYDSKIFWYHLFAQWILIYVPKCTVMKSMIEWTVKSVNSRIPIPGSLDCVNKLERFTGCCISNFVYSKILNLKHYQDHYIMAPSTMSICHENCSYQLGILPYKKEGIQETIKEKYIDLKEYINELEKNNIKHWLGNDDIFN